MPYRITITYPDMGQLMALVRHLTHKPLSTYHTGVAESAGMGP